MTCSEHMAAGVENVQQDRRSFKETKLKKTKQGFSVLDSRSTFSLQQVLSRCTINATNKAM